MTDPTRAAAEEIAREQLRQAEEAVKKLEPWHLAEIRAAYGIRARAALSSITGEGK